MRFLLTNKDELVADWVAKRIPHYVFSPSGYTAIGLMNEAGMILAGVIYENYTRRDVHVHIAANGKNWMSKRWLGEVFRYPFEQLRVERLTALIPESNRGSERFTKHLGFKKEGQVRNMLAGDEDLLVYGMLKSECRFLDLGRFHGLANKFESRSAAAAV